MVLLGSRPEGMESGAGAPAARGMHEAEPEAPPVPGPGDVEITDDDIPF